MSSGCPPLLRADLAAFPCKLDEQGNRVLLSDYTLETSTVDWADVLSHWAWLLKDVAELEVWIVTRFGDLLCRLEDDSIHLLRVGSGQFCQLAASKGEFCQMVDDKGRFAEWFMPALVDELTGKGLLLAPSQCYGFHTPPGFKEGSYSVQNAKMADLRSYLIAMGDLWGLLQDTPDGTRVRLTTSNDPQH